MSQPKPEMFSVPTRVGLSDAEIQELVQLREENRELRETVYRLEHTYMAEPDRTMTRG